MGDLIVRGGGDPTINSRGQRAAAVLDEWVAALRSAGIQKIDGRIIGDDQRFDDDGIGPGWAWDYLQFGYAAPVGALQFNENLATLTVRPAVAGQPAQVTLTPGAGFTIINRVATVAAGATPDHRLPAPARPAGARGHGLDRRGRCDARARSGGRQPDDLFRAVAQGWTDRSRDRGHRQCGRPGRCRRRAFAVDGRTTRDRRDELARRYARSRPS